MEATFIGSKHLGGFKSGLGVGTKIVDELPEMEPVLETIRGQDVLDHLGSEAVTSSAPKGCQPKLSIGVHRRSFQKTFLRMEKLANERVVQSGLPFLNECKFKAAKIGSTGKKEGLEPIRTDSGVRANSEGLVPLGRGGHW